MTNLSIVSQDEVIENQVIKSRVAKTQQPDAERLTPRVPQRQFLADASLAAFLAHSRNSEFLDQKCLLSSNSIS